MSPVNKQPSDVTLTDLRIAIKGQQSYFNKGDVLKETCILYPITLQIPKGSLFAILGGSGSGKTTLLNVLSGRYDRQSYNISGTIDFGTQDIIGYVTQHDTLLPFLTVRETLTFVAKLKVPVSQLEVNTTYETMVNRVILDLGLKECADTRIGDNDQATGKRGISGGEKRRVSIALQILTDPKGNTILYSLSFLSLHSIAV